MYDSAKKIPVPWAACGSRRKWSADMKEHGFIPQTLIYVRETFISLISILAKFVLFEYNHVVGLRETQSYNIDESV